MRQGTKYRAFTLVELAIVVLIIGMIASVAMLSLEGVTSGAKLRTFETQLGTLYRTAMFEASRHGLPCTVKLSVTHGAILIPKFNSDKWKMSEHWQTRWPRGIRVQGISSAGVPLGQSGNVSSWLISVPPRGAALHWVIHAVANSTQQADISIDGQNAATDLRVRSNDFERG